MSRENDGIEVEEDADMGQVVYAISADKSVKGKFGEVRVGKRGKWDDDVRKMNDALAKEGFEHGIIEMYSPKRVNAMAELMGVIPGMSLDLTGNDIDGKPWDFNNPEKRERAERMVREKRELLLLGSQCARHSVKFRD